MAKRRKLSPAQKQYRKERNRIKQAIKRLENRGYLVPENLLPPEPKKITPASVRRLKKLDINTIYSKSEFVDTETGEVLTGKQGKQAEIRKRADTRRAKRQNKKDKIDYVIYETQVFNVFEREMTEIFGRNERLFRYIQRWYQQSRARYGDRDFAKALEQAQEQGMFPGWEAVSSEEILVGALAGILELVGGTEGGREEIMESLEMMEDWSLPE